ncbi:MAG TPA: hypothetical protein VK427_00410 [Kofleriaceae bacterium]|nr:hypothetical protein [Kofleriaceae bacterium]
MLRTLAFGLVLLAGVGIGVGCGKGDKEAAKSGKVASCLSESIRSCVEYNANNLALGSSTIAKLCTSLDAAAKFTETPCPTANVIATCQRDEGKDVHYEGYPIAVADIEKSCKERGGTPGK